MKFFSVLKNAVVRSSEYAGRSKAMHELLNMSDRQLQDFGFSRELLEVGVGAWPWRSEAAPQLSVIRVGTFAKSEVKKAVNELSQYSDRELAELGVTRNSIEEVVQYGRPTVEGTLENHHRAA